LTYTYYCNIRSVRALGRLRLSVATDESTSIERQREIIKNWADANGHTMIGWAEDVDVSGAVDPFETPQLGDWLKNRAPEFDIIVAWKLDRITRSAIKLNNLISWCDEHDKIMLTTDNGLNTGSREGRLIAGIVGFLAEGELEAMRERQKSSRQKLRELARWPGGRPPYGYRAAPNPNGPGKVLEIDPEAHTVVQRIVQQVIDGVPLVRIVRDLNRDGVLPPRDYYRVQQGRQDTLTSWGTGPLRFLLSSPSLVGQAHLRGVVQRDEQGRPVQLAEPLVTEEQRMLIQAELERTRGVSRERAEPAALSGIALCWFCGGVLHMTTLVKKLRDGKRRYRYYRCPKGCGPMLPADDLEQLAEDNFLDLLGAVEVRKRVWVPGDDVEARKRSAVMGLETLLESAGRVSSPTVAAALQKRIVALSGYIAELESTPAQSGRWEHRPTGEFYRDVWERSSDPISRRELLKNAGVTIRIGVSGRERGTGGAWHIDLHTDLTELLTPEQFERMMEERDRQAALWRRQWGISD